jgi:molecular chaperone GrpE (heat shock protein)
MTKYVKMTEKEFYKWKDIHDKNIKKDVIKEVLKEIEPMIDNFEDMLINNLGWNKPEHHLLRGQLGIKFSLFKEKIKSILFLD